jgi:hypothetical protein
MKARPIMRLASWACTMVGLGLTGLALHRALTCQPPSSGLVVFDATQILEGPVENGACDVEFCFVNNGASTVRMSWAEKF